MTSSEGGTDVITSEGLTDTTTSDATTDVLTSEVAIDVLSSETESYIKKGESPVICARREDFLKLKGRHIKAEDFQWGKSPVLPLADIIVETAGDIKSNRFFINNLSKEIYSSNMYLHYVLTFVHCRYGNFCASSKLIKIYPRGFPKSVQSTGFQTSGRSLESIFFH